MGKNLNNRNTARFFNYLMFFKFVSFEYLKVSLDFENFSVDVKKLIDYRF